MAVGGGGESGVGVETGRAAADGLDGGVERGWVGSPGWMWRRVLGGRDWPGWTSLDPARPCEEQGAREGRGLTWKDIPDAGEGDGRTGHCCLDGAREARRVYISVVQRRRIAAKRLRRRGLIGRRRALAITVEKTRTDLRQRRANPVYLRGCWGGGGAGRKKIIPMDGDSGRLQDTLHANAHLKIPLRRQALVSVSGLVLIFFRIRGACPFSTRRRIMTLSADLVVPRQFWGKSMPECGTPPWT